MKMVLKHVIMFLALMVLVAQGSVVFAKNHKKATPTVKLVKALCDSPDKAMEAVEQLRGRKGALAKVKRFVTHAICKVDKDAVLAFYDNMGEKGCKAIAGLLTPASKDWLPVVIRRYRAMHACPALRLNLYAALDFADQNQALQILGFAVEDKSAAVGSHAFAWLDKGPEKVRIMAANAIVRGRVKNGYAKLFVTLVDRAYQHYLTKPKTYGGPWGMDSDFCVYRVMPAWDVVENNAQDTALLMGFLRGLAA